MICAWIWYLLKRGFCCCSGDETLKPQPGIQHDSISSDEENETSLDISDLSDASDGSLTASDDGEDAHTDTVPRTRPENHAAHVCAFCLLNVVFCTVAVTCAVDFLWIIVFKFIIFFYHLLIVLWATEVLFSSVCLQHPTTQFFTGRMPFLSPNQQHQSTDVGVLYMRTSG